MTLRASWLSGMSFMAVLLVMGALLWKQFELIDCEGLGSDATQNFNTAVNLLKHGVYSEQPFDEALSPGFRREPLPNFFLAIWLGLIGFLGSSLHEQALTSSIVEQLMMQAKSINLIYSAVLMLLLWFVSIRLFRPAIFANFIAVLLVVACHQFFLVQEVNGLNTELAAACILMGCVAVCLVAFETGGWFVVALCGVLFGSLVLTKASGAYVALFLIPLLSALLASSMGRFWHVLLFLSLGFVCVISPWVLRNQMIFERPVIAQGGGDVLLIRSAFNRMTLRNYRDAFYAYAPKPLQQNVLGPLLNLSDNDLTCGGSLSAFNRNLSCDRDALGDGRFDDVSSLYQQGKRAIPQQLDLTREQKSSVALERISQQPWSHVWTTVPLGWRGFWAFKPKTWIDLWINALSFLSLLCLPVLGLCCRRPVWILIPGIAAGFFAFYAGVSHFLPRYSAPLIPVALLCLAIVAIALLQRLASDVPLGLKH